MTGRSAIVTGAGTGIGRAIARALLSEGWGVTFADRSLETLVEAASADDGTGPPRPHPGPHAGHRTEHPHALVVTADVTDPTGVDALFEAHVARFGRLDLLVNVADRIDPEADAGELSPVDWQAAVAVDLTPAVLCAGAAFRQMAAQAPAGGRIVNAAVSAPSPRLRSVVRTMTTHAIAGLSASIELDGRPHAITCTQVDLGAVGIASLADALVHVANLPLGASVPRFAVGAAQ